jgi:hypothetical protein
VTYFKERSGCRRLFRRPMFFTTTGGGLDIAMRQHDADDRPYAHTNERQSNVQGVLFLLLSARASLQHHGADDECVRTMEDCVASFRLQHNLTDGEVNEGILWEETSMGALHGLLEYVHDEVSDNLQDRRCAEQLKLCIEHLKEDEPELNRGTRDDRR